MTNQLFTLNITLNSRTSDVPELTSLSISAVDREQAITKLFDNHLRYTNSVDIE